MPTLVCGTIRQVFRGSRVMGWRDVRLNKVAQHVFMRQEMEFQERLDGGRARYEHFVHEANRWDENTAVNFRLCFQSSST